MNSTYLDYNATAPLRPEAREALLAALAQPGNPSSVHRFGRAARGLADTARGQVAGLVNASPKRVVFTGGGTEANNLAFRLATGTDPGQGGVKSVIVAGIEHDSVLRPARALGLPGRELPVEADGVLGRDALIEALAAMPKPALVCLMLANNETGAIQPVKAATELTHEAGGLLLCDAVQAAGKIGVDMAALGCDFLTLSGHKLGGPTGVGALVLRDDWTPAPMIRGGGQEQGMRAGTENLGGIAAMGAAAVAALHGLLEMHTVERLRDRLEKGLLEACPEAPVHGREARLGRLPNTLCIGMPGVPAETQVMAFDLAGLAVSAGSACSSGKVAPSHVLAAMGLSEEVAREAVRFSLGWGSKPADIDRAIEIWTGFWVRKRK